MQIFVTGLDGETFTVETVQHTVDEVQQQIEHIEGVPAELQRLVFEGKGLQPGRQLAHYNVRQYSTLHLTMILEGGRHIPWRLEVLAMWHLLNKQICRKCYGRLSSSTRCSKAKCGRTSDIRPKKHYRISELQNMFGKNPLHANFLRAANKYPHLL